jgi:hypothetical protein
MLYLNLVLVLFFRQNIFCQTNLKYLGRSKLIDDLEHFWAKISGFYIS